MSWCSNDEFVQQFGATSTDSVTIRGQWMYQSAKYSDQLIRIRIDLDDKPENWQAVRDAKEILKERFDQLDLWVTAHRIDVI